MTNVLAAVLGNLYLYLTNGKFPRDIKHNSERSKTGLMLNTNEGKINEIKFCFAFLKTENKYQIEIDRAKKITKAINN